MDEAEIADLQKFLDQKSVLDAATAYYEKLKISLQALRAERPRLASQLESVVEQIAKLPDSERQPETFAEAAVRVVGTLTVFSLEDRKGKLESALSELDEKIRKEEDALLNASGYLLITSFTLDRGPITDSANPLPQALTYLQEVAEAINDNLNKITSRIDATRERLTPAVASGDAGSAQAIRSELRELEKDQAEEQKKLDHAKDLAERREQIAEFAKTDRCKFETVADIVAAAKLKMPSTLVVERVGLNGELRLIVPDEIDTGKLRNLIWGRIPRVELVNPVRTIVDSVDRKEIEQEDFSFMRGVFYYSDIFRDEWDQVFEQSDVTTKRLGAASRALNDTLKRTWSQGNDLKFFLQHNSKNGKIELYIEDPVIASRHVRASRRSSGFTHFFTLKTILHARQTESPASSYIWLFDEPGLYLHPDGQHDLLQVVETLALTNQVIYSTHSLFMINKNFPSRHRLVFKSKTGTKIDAKPYQGQWKSAIDALGLSLPGTILFASKVLLVEGDSDPIYMNALLQKLIEIGRLNIDVNELSVISTGNSKNADALIRLLGECAIKPRVAALFDGDKGGKERAKALEKVMATYEIKYKVLPDETTIEDHLLNADRLFVRAVAEYVAKVSGVKSDELIPIFEGSFTEKITAQPDARAGIAAWSRSTGKEIGQLVNDPSPIGIAREYALSLLDAPASLIDAAPVSARPQMLANWVAEVLELPKQIIENPLIVR